MSEIITISLDIAKNVFQVHGIDGSGGIVIRRNLRRGDVAGFFGLPPAWLAWKPARLRIIGLEF